MHSLQIKCVFVSLQTPLCSASEGLIHYHTPLPLVTAWCKNHSISTSRKSHAIEGFRISEVSPRCASSTAAALIWACIDISDTLTRHPATTHATRLMHTGSEHQAASLQNWCSWRHPSCKMHQHCWQQRIQISSLPTWVAKLLQTESGSGPHLLPLVLVSHCNNTMQWPCLKQRCKPCCFKILQGLSFSSSLFFNFPLASLDAS